MQIAKGHIFPAPLVAVAFAAALAAAGVAWRYGLRPETPEFGIAIIALAVATACDFESRTIPNACIAVLLGARAAFLAIGSAAGIVSPGDIIASLAGMAVIGGGLLAMAIVADRLLRTESIGGGDIKLFAAAGAYFGMEGGAVVVFTACLLGLLTSRLLDDGDGRFAFGPAIALAFCLVMTLT